MKRSNLGVVIFAWFRDEDNLGLPPSKWGVPSLYTSLKNGSKPRHYVRWKMLQDTWFNAIEVTDLVWSEQGDSCCYLLNSNKWDGINGYRGRTNGGRGVKWDITRKMCINQVVKGLYR
jgi:hypothetical protein